MKKIKIVFSILGILAPISLFIFITILGIFWQGYDLISGYVSDLASRSSPFKFVTDFFGFGLFSVIMAGFCLVLDSDLHSSRWSKIATRLFLGGSLSLLVLVLFPTDLRGAPQTLDGNLHTLFGSMAFLMLSLSLFWYGKAFQADKNWDGFWKPMSNWLGGISFAASAIIELFPHNFYNGTIERIGIGSITLWVFFVSINLLLRQTLNIARQQ